MAAVVPEARSKRPARGLATVPTTPLGMPVRKPYGEKRGEGEGRNEREGEKIKKETSPHLAYT